MTEFNNDVRELTDAELDAISGGNWLGDAARFVGHKTMQIVQQMIQEQESQEARPGPFIDAMFPA